MMKLAEKPSDLEQLVARIHRLIEPTGATVTWNEKVVDPDTGQTRQIDGLIRRDGKNLHIECRDQDQTQNVKWIEELIGRRSSLRADGIIGVSTSGFTVPSMLKAARFGIVLRTLSEMPDAEVREWGKAARLFARYVEIRECILNFAIDRSQLRFLSAEPQMRIGGSDFPPIIGILEAVIRNERAEFFPDRNTNISCSIRIRDLELDGASVLSTSVHLRGRLRTEQVNVVGFWNYSRVETSSTPEVVVSRHELANTELIQHEDLATWTFDLSNLPERVNCFPYSWGIDFGRPVTFRLSPIGVPRLKLDVGIVLEVTLVN